MGQPEVEERTQGQPLRANDGSLRRSAATAPRRLRRRRRTSTKTRWQITMRSRRLGGVLTISRTSRTGQGIHISLHINVFQLILDLPHVRMIELLIGTC